MSCLEMHRKSAAVVGLTSVLTEVTSGIESDVCVKTELVSLKARTISNNVCVFICGMKARVRDSVMLVIKGQINSRNSQKDMFVTHQPNCPRLLVSTDCGQLTAISFVPSFEFTDSTGLE